MFSSLLLNIVINHHVIDLLEKTPMKDRMMQWVIAEPWSRGVETGKDQQEATYVPPLNDVFAHNSIGHLRSE